MAPAASPLKLKLLSAFLKSTTAANSFPHTLRIIFDSVYGESATMRTKQLGMEFAVWVFKHVSTSTVCANWIFKHKSSSTVCAKSDYLHGSCHVCVSPLFTPSLSSFTVLDKVRVLVLAFWTQAILLY